MTYALVAYARDYRQIFEVSEIVTRLNNNPKLLPNLEIISCGISVLDHERKANITGGETY
jgi:hypothetical protein